MKTTGQNTYKDTYIWVPLNNQRIDVLEQDNTSHHPIVNCELRPQTEYKKLQTLGNNNLHVDRGTNYIKNE